MRSIDERELAVLIPLLAAKIHEMSKELHETEGKEDELSDEELDARDELQEMRQEYDLILENLRVEYEAGLTDGINLPSFAVLTEKFEYR
jgi:hypothetical protein